MRFVLYQSALDGSDELLALVDQIIDRVADEVHRIELPDADTLRESSWYRGARGTRRKIMLTAAASPPRQRQGLHSSSIDVRDTGDASAAAKLASSHLMILVENRESDGIFLDILVEEMGDHELKALWQRNNTLTPSAFEIVTSGGRDEIPQRLERAITEARARGIPPRIFVFCDSDKRWPGDPDENNERRIKKIEEKCSRHGVEYCILKKRYIENYIPDETYKAAQGASPAHLRDRFDALLRRTPTQRDHFPVKRGMSDKERTEATAAGLYSDGDAHDLSLLKEPVFQRLSSKRLFGQLQEDFRSSFTAEGLRKRDGCGELDGLLDAISRKL